MEVLAVEEHLVNEAHMIEYFGLVAAWMGEKEPGCEHMEKATGLSGSGLLTQWDPLRGDPRFQKIVASLALLLLADWLLYLPARFPHRIPCRHLEFPRRPKPNA